MTKDTVSLLIHAVFEFASSMRKYRKPVNKHVEPLIETALQQEFYTIVLALIENTPAYSKLSLEVKEGKALIISWTILGTAIGWSHSRNPLQVDIVSTEILHMLLKGVEL